MTKDECVVLRDFRAGGRGLDGRQALEGIKIIDAATLFAGPLAATVLGDFGAEVIKVEHPRGDPSRSHGYSKDGVGLWWKMLGRNKRCVTLNLSKPEGQEIFARLASDADVVIESFRPGTLERWNLGYERLSEINPGLILARVTGPQPTVYDRLGEIQQRSGNRSVNNAPRNTYQTKDGHWVAVSTSAQNIAERVMRLVGHPEYIDEPWFAKGSERAKHADELDEAVGAWISDRTQEEVVAAFEEAGAAVAPIYDIEGIMQDPQYDALNSIITIDDPELGPTKMQNVLFRLSETPGEVRWSGPTLGAHNEEVYGELGIGGHELDEISEKGIL